MPIRFKIYYCLLLFSFCPQFGAAGREPARQNSVLPRRHRNAYPDTASFAPNFTRLNDAHRKQNVTPEELLCPPGVPSEGSRTPEII